MAVGLEIWDVLQHFGKHEKWGDPDKMNPALLVLLDKLREIIGKPIIIHCGYDTDGHAPSSQHYVGNAVDFHIVGLPIEQAHEAMQGALHMLGLLDRVGLGIYPFWNSPGFHLDVRGEAARWGRLKNGTYVAYDTALNEYLEAA
jgi:uncharacterized protein YcbK (DUF882 family)